MRKFRYIESGHGDYNLSNHEINELDVDFDIKVDGFYALMPVTKYEFGLLVSSSNRGWTKEDERLPVDDPGAEKQWKLADDPIMLSDEVVKFIKAEIKDELDRRGFENSEYQGGGDMNHKPYASYEKTIKTTVIETTHTVRIKIGDTAATVRDILEKVPGCAVCVWIMGDDEGDFPNAGEIGFVSEK